jgi:hypothetical protein
LLTDPRKFHLPMRFPRSCSSTKGVWTRPWSLSASTWRTTNLLTSEVAKGPAEAWNTFATSSSYIASALTMLTWSNKSLLFWILQMKQFSQTKMMLDKFFVSWMLQRVFHASNYFLQLLICKYHIQL